MRAIPGAIVLILLCGCTSQSSSILARAGAMGATGVRVNTVRSGSAVIDTGHGGRIGVITFAVPAEEIWSALPAVFTALNLEVNSDNARSRIMGLENVRIRRIAGSRPSHYLECGHGITGANADVYDVYLTVLTNVSQTQGNASTLQIVVNAIARDPSTSGSPVQCVSNGQLEVDFTETLRALSDAAGASRRDPRQP